MAFSQHVAHIWYDVVRRILVTSVTLPIMKLVFLITCWGRGGEGRDGHSPRLLYYINIQHNDIWYDPWWSTYNTLLSQHQAVAIVAILSRKKSRASSLADWRSISLTMRKTGMQRMEEMVMTAPMNCAHWG